jgi:laccase
LLAGEWWQRDLMKVDRNFSNGGDFSDNPAGATINGKLGDQYNCSGILYNCHHQWKTFAVEKSL